MSNDIRKFKKGIQVEPVTSTDIDTKGEIEVLDASGKLNYHNGTTASPVVTESHSATLTNKTIDGDDNTVQDLALTSLKTNVTDAGRFVVRDGSGVVVSNTKNVPSGDVVGTSDSQALTNKTIDGDLNTVQDLALTSIKTDAGNANKVLQRDGSGVVTNGPVVPSGTGDLVRTDSTQTLTNKTYQDASLTGSIDGSTSTNVDLGTSNTATTVDIGTGTGANTINIGGANSTVNFTGTVNNNNVTNLNVTDKLITINDGGGAGSGGNAGFEIEESGSPTGYVQTSTDRNSFTFKAPNTAGIATLTPGASNDDVVMRQASQTLTNKTLTTPIINQINTSTNTDLVLDPNGSGIVSVVGALKSDTSLILEETGAGTDIITIQAPSSITSSYTLTLPVDDGTSGQSLTTDGSGVLSWSTITTTTYSTTTKNTTYTATNSDQVILVDSSISPWTLTLPAGTTGKWFRITKVTSDFTAVTIDGDASEQIRENGISSNTTTLNTVGESIDLQWTGTLWEVTNRRTEIGETSYTPTFSGLGTPTNVAVYWNREGKFMRIHGRWQNGTVSAASGAISLPGSVTIDTTTRSTSYRFICGEWTRDAASSVASGRMLISTATSDTNVYFGTAFGDSSVSGLTLRNGNVFTGTNEVISVQFLVPISGWKG